MKWDMELEELEAILEKIWDLHDKLSDAIHSISRTHFLNSVKALRKHHNNNINKKKQFNLENDAVEDSGRAGFVFVKDFRVDDDDSAIQEAKSLNAIRTALENLEDQLEFFHVSLSSHLLGFPSIFLCNLGIGLDFIYLSFFFEPIALNFLWIWFHLHLVADRDNWVEIEKEI